MNKRKFFGILVVLLMIMAGAFLVWKNQAERVGIVPPIPVETEEPVPSPTASAETPTLEISPSPTEEISTPTEESTVEPKPTLVQPPPTSTLISPEPTPTTEVEYVAVLVDGTVLPISCPVPKEYCGTGVSVNNSLGDYAGLSFSLPPETPILAVADGVLFGSGEVCPPYEGIVYCESSPQLLALGYKFSYLHTGVATHGPGSAREVSAGDQIGTVADYNFIVRDYSGFNFLFTVRSPDGSKTFPVAFQPIG